MFRYGFIRIISTVCLAAVLLMLPIGGVVYGADAFYDSFEDEAVSETPQNWVDRSGTGVLTVAEENGNRFARISWTGDAAALPVVSTKTGALMLPFRNGAAQRVVIEARLRMQSAAYRDYLRINFPQNPSVPDHNGNRYALWFSKPNDQNYYFHYLLGDTKDLANDPVWHQPSFVPKPLAESPAVGEWFTYRAVIDTDSGDVRHEINGRHSATGRLDAQEFENMDVLSALVFTWRNQSGGTDVDGDGCMDFDDVRVYTLMDGCDITVVHTANGQAVSAPITGKIGTRVSVTNGVKATKLYAVTGHYNSSGVLLSAQKSELQTVAARGIASITLPEIYVNGPAESLKTFVLDDRERPLIQAKELSRSHEEASKAVTLYVSAAAGTGGDGSVAAPFATLTEARDAIRSLRRAGVSPEKGFTVYLRGGEYQMMEGLHLTAEDSGAVTAPVVYSAYPGEQVTLVGGAEIPASAFHQVHDAAFLNRIVDEAAREHILVADLAALGFTDFGEAYWPGAYSYFMKGLHKPDYPSPELFIGGELQTVARYPNEGYMQVAEVIDPGAYPRMWEDDKKGEAGYVEEGDRDPTDGFVIRPDDERYKKWTQVPENEALLYGFWRWDWADHTVPLKKVYAVAEKLESGVPSWYSVVQGAKFYAFNLPEEIDVPGEYYLDRTNKKLYLYPPENFETADIKLSVLEDNLVTIEGASHITLQNMTMTAARGSAVSMKNAESCRIDGCEISYTAGRSVIVGSGCKKSGVANSYIHDVNGGILLSGGVRNTLLPGENYAENNDICRFARLNRTYNAAVELNGVGNICAHNEMHEAVHLAVQFSGNNHIIQYNDIHHVVTANDDMGAVYTGRSWADRGTQINYNYFHDLASSQEGSHGIYGIYLDDRFCETTMYGNLFEDIEGAAIFVHGGRDNCVENNLLVRVSGGLRLRSIVPPDPEADTSNLVKSLSYVPYQGAIWAAAYPNLPNILEDEPSYPKYNRIQNNVSLASGGALFEGVFRSYSNEENLVNCLVSATETDFADAAGGDYRFTNQATVLQQVPAFVSLPFDKMGRYAQ